MLSSRAPTGQRAGTHSNGYLSRKPALLCVARRTVREKEAPSKTKERHSASPAPKQSPPAPNGTAQKSSRQGTPAKKGDSQLSQFMKRSPVLSRFVDGTLIFGDIVMLLATEASSERIPVEAIPTLAGVSIISWVIASAALGDYKGEVPSSDNWYMSMLGPAFTSIVDSTLTWALSAVLSLVIFSVLVSGGHLDSMLLLEDLSTENLSPQLEVAVATLVTMSCWRGIAARLRY